MPFALVNGVELNYRLEGEGSETVVLINGLADDLETWVYQVDALLAAGFRVLRFDNRGIGKSAKPAGPYTTELLAQDAKNLVDHLGLSNFHLMGVSMGGMIAQEYALAFPGDLKSLTLACTYAAPGPFCSRMFSLWADIVPIMGVPTVMRDVTLWAFTQEFFQIREEELTEFETAMAYMDQSVPAYLAQLHSIRHHDATARLHQILTRTLVLAGEEDILIPVSLSRALHELIPGSEFRTTAGGHGCIWEHPDSFNQQFISFIRASKGKKINVTR